MMLNDTEIRYLCKEMKLVEPFNEESLTPNGYDLTVDIMWYDDAQTKPRIRHVVTLETISMPDNIGATLHIKSSLSRQGVIGSFGFVDAGFVGKLEFPFMLPDGLPEWAIHKDQKVVQIVFHQLNEAVEKSYGERSGNYQGFMGYDDKGIIKKEEPTDKGGKNNVRYVTSSISEGLYNSCGTK